ncbi:hypothetical protein Asi03nite_31430 [Actinoplanes siamensis]|uniref:Oxidoreductase molybdopterin-binding domain-containing protein n=1 Tax=Actinoplanes siamensis TaxID=1223317 RepID=A0A919TKX6_9ACTN|nr:hypothetical protein Asi03nite_31430 [Actinoplanes siamensis]
MIDEAAYDEARLRDWAAGRARGFSRRNLFALAAAVGTAGLVPSPARAADSPIVKPLPPELFTVLGTNAETKWSALKDQGYLVPVDRFFVRNHTSTPRLDGSTWHLEISGSGLRGEAAHLTLADLRRLPARTHTVTVECAGNGRGYFGTQQGQTVSGTAWGLGAVGVARWRGVPLSTVLRRVGLRRDALDVQAAGLDPNYVTGGVDLGPVRRPMPLAKALDDVLLAYEMNGEPLPPDHGFPVRLIVPRWIGISSIKWVGTIDVSAEPLFSPWNTQFYRLFGPGFPAEGRPFDRQVIKSAFELDPGTTFTAGRRVRLTGRSWSAGGADPRGRGEHRRRRLVAARPVRRPLLRGGVAALGTRLAAGRRRPFTAGPGHRRARQFPAGRGALQHARISVRRGGPGTGHRRMKSGRGESPRPDPAPHSGREGVLDLLAGLLQVRAGLVRLALGLQTLVVGGLADAFLDLAAEFLGLVVDLVVESHSAPPGVQVCFTRCITHRRRSHTSPFRVTLSPVAFTFRISCAPSPGLASPCLPAPASRVARRTGVGRDARPERDTSSRLALRGPSPTSRHPEREPTAGTRGAPRTALPGVSGVGELLRYGGRRPGERGCRQGRPSAGRRVRPEAPRRPRPSPG